MRVHSHVVDYNEDSADESLDQQEPGSTQDWPDEKTAFVYEALLAVYGKPNWRPHHPPMDELVLTILSQHTSDINSGRAFASLRLHFPTWEQVRDAPVPEIAEAIKSGGLAQMKAPRIKEILGRIWQERGNFDLSFLDTIPLADAEKWLASLPGVGPKTAACVLLFSCGREAMPVDTHVHRVTRRLGLVPDRFNAEQAHELLEKMMPAEWYYAFHLNVIKHGREVCKAARPLCEICVLKSHCDFYRNGVPASYLPQPDAAYEQ